MTEVWLDIDDGVATVTIDRPQVRNAIGLATVQELGDVLDEVAAGAANVLVLRGAGEHAFVSGGDLKELAAIREEQGAAEMAIRMRRLLDRIATFPIPTIAGLNGHAFGGGAEVAVAADIRFAADDVQIGFNQVTLGIMPAWGGAERLVEIIGRGKALLLVGLGTRLSATDAQRMGLVDVLARREDFETSLHELAQGFGQLTPAASKGIKSVIAAAHPHVHPDCEASAVAHFAALWASDDHWLAAEQFLSQAKRARPVASLQTPANYDEGPARGQPWNVPLSSSTLMSARVLIAKPGLDGHDRGAKLVSRALRDAGFEVIYTGIRQRPKEIAAAAVQEDVQVVGLSILSGAHVALTRKVATALNELGADDVQIVVGGTISARDVPRLLEAGAVAVFPTGTPLEDLINGMQKLMADETGATQA